MKKKLCIIISALALAIAVASSIIIRRKKRA